MSSPNKQSSPDSLPTWLFKKIGVNVAPFLVAYLIDCLKKDMFQAVLKRPSWVLWLRKKDLTVMICVVSVQFEMFLLVSKMLERLVYERINIHLGKIGTLPLVQSAFIVIIQLKQHSPKMSLILSWLQTLEMWPCWRTLIWVLHLIQ